MIKAQRGVLKNLVLNPRRESRYDSLLERDYMLEIDSMSGVKEWTKDHGITIPYKIFGVLPQYYVPDFLITFLDGSKEIHETKGAGFLAWASTHAKRYAGDQWCKARGMKYRFIENSRGALFVQNNAIENTQKRQYSSISDMLGADVKK